VSPGEAGRHLDGLALQSLVLGEVDGALGWDDGWEVEESGLDVRPVAVFARCNLSMYDSVRFIGSLASRRRRA
jgi:hypothetical protein